MDINKQLRAFREEVSSAIRFDNDFKELIGVRIFDFVTKTDELKDIFYGRLNYLKDLSKDKKFIALQDNIFNTIQKILSLTTIGEVQQAQTRWRGGMIVNLLRTQNVSDSESIFYTLPNLYRALQSKDNYHRLGLGGRRIVTNEEISTITPIMPVLRQYEGNVSELFKILFIDKVFKNTADEQQLNNLMEEYDEHIEKLNEQMYRAPVKQRIQSFEKFFLTCANLYPVENYTFFYDPVAYLNIYKNDKKRFEEIKKHTLAIIDELLQHCETKPSETTEAQSKTIDSLCLVSESILPKTIISLVIDGRFNKPIKFPVKNKDGGDTYIMKLYNIAYSFGNAPGKRVAYDPILADSINNKLFRRRVIADYLKSKGLKSPTIVRKVADYMGESLVLDSATTTVKTILLNKVPQDYRNLYFDKTTD